MTTKFWIESCEELEKPLSDKKLCWSKAFWILLEKSLKLFLSLQLFLSTQVSFLAKPSNLKAFQYLFDYSIRAGNYCAFLVGDFGAKNYWNSKFGRLKLVQGKHPIS